MMAEEGKDEFEREDSKQVLGRGAVASQVRSLLAGRAELELRLHTTCRYHGHALGRG